DILGRPANADRYDIILTSETIYSEDSIPRLIHVITNVLKKPSGVAYVAAKTIYFGVSGGTLPFRALVERARDADGHGLEIETVAEVTGTNTVKREVLRVRWRV
ncbi:histidine protein methyltransferase 1, partial [Jimgerdemannia flammicorona]